MDEDGDCDDDGDEEIDEEALDDGDSEIELLALLEADELTLDEGLWEELGLRLIDDDTEEDTDELVELEGDCDEEGEREMEDEGDGEMEDEGEPAGACVISMYESLVVPKVSAIANNM